MNKDNAHLYLPLVQALADGKLELFHRGVWTDCFSTDFSGSLEEYRIKPEPREWWFCEIDGNGFCIGRYVFASQSEAQNFAAINGVKVVHVREVLP